MSTSHPHLDERVRTRRSRWMRILIGFCTMVLVMVIAWLIVWTNAGRWGVPMFSFTNEHGSKCRNDFIGRSCSPMTLEDIRFRSQVEIPDGTKVLLSSWKETHDFELTARLVYPGGEAKGAGWIALSKKFGECRQNAPSPLSTVPDLDGLCVMSNETVRTEGGQPTDRIWQISTANQKDGTMLVHMDIKSR
ncbi:hypothetical protein [Enemella dayhoffiae]|nr:hypothetical protein [Enemella dayhoffiae]